MPEVIFNWEWKTFGQDLGDAERKMSDSPHAMKQWTPILKSAFPLNASDIENIFTSFPVSLPTLACHKYAPVLFLNEPANQEEKRIADMTSQGNSWPGMPQ